MPQAQMLFIKFLSVTSQPVAFFWRAVAVEAPVTLPSLQKRLPSLLSHSMLLAPQGVELMPPPRIMVPRGAGSIMPPAQHIIFRLEPSRPPMKEKKSFFRPPSRSLRSMYSFISAQHISALPA